MRTRRGPAWTIICLAALIGVALGLAAPASRPAYAQWTCNELIVNGSFESTGGWVAGADVVPPRYVSDQAHAGQRSLLLGIPQGGANQRSYSSVRQQITIPADAVTASLSFWYLAIMPGAPETDYLELALLAPDGRNLLDKPWRAFVDNRVWNQVSLDISGWRGQTLQVYLNAFNDGAGPVATMYLDEVSLAACRSAGTVIPTPTRTPLPTVPSGPPTATFTPVPVWPTAVPPTPAPTATPAPIGPPAANCTDVLGNGGFESGIDGWYTAPNMLPVQLVNSPVRGGHWALRLGSQDANLNSYSSIRQPLHVPEGYGQVYLDFSTWTWAESTSGADHQEGDFLAPDLAVLQKFWRPLANDRAWTRHTIQVNAYAGQDVVAYFNVYNDGLDGRTAMYLDEVHLWACAPYAVSPSAGNPQPDVVEALTPPPDFETIPPADETIPPDVPVPTAAPGGATAAPLATAAPAMATASAAATTSAVATTSAAATSTAAAGPTAAASTSTPRPGTPGPVSPIPTLAAARGIVASAPATPPPAGNLISRLPQGWPLGLLAIVIVVLLLLLVLRGARP